jgi:uncharacterized radical SAM superfamily protein
MIPTVDPEAFSEAVDHLRLNGAHGILVSGGADQNGEVPLEKFIPPIKTLKENDPQFRVIVHTGLIRRETANKLKEAGVDQILIDVIGDDDTIREVYHLNKRVEDYEETLWMLKDGHARSPHHHRASLWRDQREWRVRDGIASC